MWFYKDNIVDNVLEEFDSFVYLIERLNTQDDSDSPVYYVGKKTFYNKTKLNNKRVIVESDWYDYYGSSEQLTSDIEKYGKENFKRHILHFCRTKGDAGYLEAKEQIDRNVLSIKNGKKLYYNKNILGRYRYEPDIYLIEDSLESYFALDNFKSNKKWVTDGKTNRLMLNKQADDLVSKSNWNYGRAEKHIIVNDGIEIPKSEFDEKIHTIPEQTTKLSFEKSLERLKVSIIKNREQKWVLIDEIDDYLEKGWERQGNSSGFKIYTVTDEISQKTFNSIIEKDEFLENNPNWRNGGINKESVKLDGMVIVKDVLTDEKKTVTKDEFKRNPNLVSLKTKKVKVKSKNRIIFTGYLELFIIENTHFSKKQLLDALKSDSGEIIGENMSISYI